MNIIVLRLRDLCAAQKVIIAFVMVYGCVAFLVALFAHPLVLRNNRLLHAMCVCVCVFDLCISDRPHWVSFYTISWIAPHQEDAHSLHSIIVC